MSGLVIRHARQDRDGTIDLFGQHCPDKAMGPGLRTKRHCIGGRAPDRFAISFRPADQEHEIGYALVPETRELAGKIG